MQISTANWIGSALSDEDYLGIARDLLANGTPGALADILSFAGRHADLWSSEAGVDLLADLLAGMIDMLAEGRISDAIAATDRCPADLARQAIDLLLIAFFPDENEADLRQLDDAATLALALLVGASGRGGDAAALVDEALSYRIDEEFAFAAMVVRSHVAPAAPGDAFKCKLVIWDLDDTLWRGTLADGDEPQLDERRAEFIRAYNRHGIVSAICSKNDHDAARAVLEAHGLWQEFVFPRIAFLPKGEVVRSLIADMQLRPANVLFVDDNVRNLREVEAAVPGIVAIDASSPQCDAMLGRILEDNRHIAKSRVEEYRIIETRVAERRQSTLTDAAFLRQSAIEASYIHRMDNLDFAERIEELINRSNQLNYTGSRIEPGKARDLILNVSDYDVFSAFVWDRYGYYGLVGTAVYDKTSGRLVHFAFSCRIMHMGVEDFLFGALCDRYGRVDLSLLRKPLPAQSSEAICWRPFEIPEVRARILAEEAPRDWSKVRLRLMCDCQSGAFHHYSRFREAMDFDNIPRIFSLPMMLSGEHAGQSFPEFLVYTPATDYMDWRWPETMPVIDPAAYEEAARRFEAMLISGGHSVLLLLPPEDAPDVYYDVVATATPAEMRARNRTWNALWRAMAERHPDAIRCIELTGVIETDDMAVHAYHYTPSALQRMAGIIDDWYEAQA